MKDQPIDAPEETGATPVEPALAKNDQRAWAGIARDLTPEDLSSPGAQKLLLDNLEQLSRENQKLSSLQDELHTALLENCRLNGRLDTKKAIEIASMAMSNVGAVLVGFGPFVWDSQRLATAVCLLLGTGLVVAGFLAQRISR
jgi:hypothetical protein